MPEFHRPAPVPAAGDVVIAKVSHSDPVWVLSTHPGVGQCFCRTYEQAVRQAKGFARRHRADVFATEDGGATFSIIARFHD